MEPRDQIIPFVWCFYGSPSTYLWEDETGNVQHIPEGDLLMPFLFEMGLHVSAMKAKLRNGEKEIVFLNDVYVICTLEMVSDVHKVLEEFSSIKMHHGKTQVWNRGNVCCRLEKR